MMIYSKKKPVHIDDEFDGWLIRGFADTVAAGYLSALHITPAGKAHDDILNVNLVLTEFPKFLAGEFDFEYTSKNRLARRAGFGFGRFEHIHLSATDEQINYLIRHIGKKVSLAGDEIAIGRNGKSWFWVDPKAVEWLGLNSSHELAQEVAGILRNAPSNETQCHSVWLRSINMQASGSGMNAHFAASAAGVTGLGNQIARDSLDKAKKSLDEKQKNARRQRTSRAGNSRNKRNGDAE